MQIPDASGYMVGMAKAVEQMGYALGQLTWVTRHSAAILIQSIPIFRRAKIEAELGYRVPNWVWRVWEHQRRTEGSGNGRILRD